MVHFLISCVPGAAGTVDMLSGPGQERDSLLINTLHIQLIMSKDLQWFAMNSIFIGKTKNFHHGWVMHGCDLGDRCSQSAKDTVLLNR